MCSLHTCAVWRLCVGDSASWREHRVPCWLLPFFLLHLIWLFLPPQYFCIFFENSSLNICIYRK